jgi:flagellar biosynthesis protein FliR
VQEFLLQAEEQFYVFLLVLVRVASIISFAPVFGSRSVIPQVKILLSLFIAGMLVFAMDLPMVEFQGWVDLFIRAVTEVLLGVAIGYAGTLLFEVVQFGGELVGLQMGFGIVNVIDPLTSVRVSLIGQMKFILAVFIFLGIGGHRMIVEAMGRSLEIVGPGMLVFDTDLGMHFVEQFGRMLVVSIKVAAPVMVSLLLASFAEGIVARTVPQMNIFIVGFGIRIAFGMFSLMLSLGFFVLLIGKHLGTLPVQMETVLRFFLP